MWSGIIIVSLIITIAILIGLILVLTYKFSKQNEIFEKTGYNGKYYPALNNLYHYSNDQVYYGYELLDFDRSVKEHSFIMFEPEGLTDPKTITWDRIKSKKDLTVDESLAISSAPSSPLSEKKLIELSDSLNQAQEHYRLMTYKYELQRKKEALQMANSSDERFKNSHLGAESIKNYRDNVEKERLEHRKQLDESLENMKNIIKNADHASR